MALKLIVDTAAVSETLADALNQAKDTGSIFDAFLLLNSFPGVPAYVFRVEMTRTSITLLDNKSGKVVARLATEAVRA